MKVFFAALLALLSYVDGTAYASASAVSTGGGIATASSNAVASVFKPAKKGGYPYYQAKPYYYPKPTPVKVQKVDPVIYAVDGKKKEQPVIVIVDDTKPKDVVVEDKKDNKKNNKKDNKNKAEAEAIATASATTDSGDAECSSIAATAVATPELSSLVEALTQAGLVETLSDPSFVATVLAPTNEAFEKLIASFGVTLDQLLMDPQLTNILLYHVIGDAAVLSGDLQRQFCSVFWQDRAELTTLLGQTVTVDLSDGVSFVGFGSTGSVVVADVVACQAVVHVIDEVLLPDFDIIAAAVDAAEGS
eukprot:TRINITY_DN6779_c0_g1_i4.p1 TRINITY_DN6779_c0_g1~~TRINITY_DN6779_c0_g1_i4.p1  ORF type:complete len:337 (+),score=71.84 TRINITY_DN6779_c0_g1_i4:102-1013(+)